MPDLWMDVDTALASVPVNILPLLDATDFKTIEDAVAYNAAGLALFWNFSTPGGVTTVTAVTPTSGGAYDWTDFTTSGMYGIEIPASGGGSINNDTEGVGHFTGVATGVLPWRGPTIGFRAAGLNDALIESAYSTTRGLAGTALPAAAADAAGGLVISDAGGLDADAQRADVAAILVDTAEIGTAGAGLTNINLPNQTMDIVGNITGNLSGSVGSVGAGGITATSIATGAIDADALATDAVNEIVDQVWDEAIAGHLGAGSTGEALSDAGGAGTPPTAIENADALLDRADAIETGLTPRGALRLISGATAGELTGAATTTVEIRNAVADSKVRITATVDASGNRTAITTDTT